MQGIKRLWAVVICPSSIFAAMVRWTQWQDVKVRSRLAFVVDLDAIDAAANTRERLDLGHVLPCPLRLLAGFVCGFLWADIAQRLPGLWLLRLLLT